MRRRRRRTDQPAGTEAPQLDHLVVMRESARYDHVLMVGMIAQTLAKVSHLPGAAELARAGIDVVKHPERWGASVRRAGGSQMVMVERDGALYLYAMGSAAKADLDDTNAIVSELVNLVATYRPREAWVSSFTRLLRSADHVGDLLRAFSEHTQVLHCETEVNVATPEGRMLFQVLAMIASMERDYILRRHTAGRVAQCRRGDWVPNAWPPGYKKQDGRLVVDEARVGSVRQMLAVLATEGLAPAQMVARLGELGIATPKISRTHGEKATIADARNPSQAVQALCGWVELYATGRHETLWPNPFPGVDAIAGLEVEKLAGYEHGALRLAQVVPLPEGGWADKATFDAVRRRAGTPSPTGGASHDQVPPLSGLFRFSDAGSEYALLSEPRAYVAARRPVLEGRRFKGWTAEVPDDSERLALVGRSDLHRCIADALVEALGSGLPAELGQGRFQAFGALPPLDGRRSRARALRSQLAEATEKLERARRNARLAGDDDAAMLFVEDTKRYHAEKARLENELEAAEAELNRDELGQSFETNAELFAHALAALAGTDQSAPVAVRDALRTVVSGERWWLEGSELCWELYVELPHPLGTVLLGPVRGRTAARLVPRGGPATPPRSKRTRTRDLVELGLGRRAALSATACPHPDLVGTLRAHLAGEAYPAGVDHAWGDFVVSVYCDPGFSWDRGQWRLEDQVRRQVLGLLSAGGGQLGLGELVRAGLKPEQLRYLYRQTNAPSGEPVIERVGRPAGDATVYSVLACPHCGGMADRSVLTPETRPGVLCPTCRRAPRPGSPVYPEWYCN